MHATLTSPARASRRVRRDGAQKRERYREIVAAAFEEFSDRGYESTRLDDVAQRAGIAKGTVYLYFKNKEMLFRAVLREQITHVLSDFEKYAQKSSGSAEELIRELLSRQYSKLVQNSKARSIVRLLISESRKFPQLSEIYYKDMIEPGIRAMRRILERAAASGEFRQSAISKFPQLLLAPGVLAVLWSLMFGDRHPLDVEGYKEAHLQLALSALHRSVEPASPVAVAADEEDAP
jgi:AcrR family transcriptional regulator